MIENSSKTPLSLKSITMHILGQKFSSISQGLSQKKEIEKWLLRTSVQCIDQSGMVSLCINRIPERQFWSCTYRKLNVFIKVLIVL